MSDALVATEPPDDLGRALGALRGLRQHRALLVGLPLVAVAVVAATSMIGSRTYTSRASFMTQSGSTTVSPVSTLAAQFGVNLSSGGEPGQSPDFYSEMLKSRTLVDRTFGGQTPQARRLREAVHDMDISASQKSGIMTLEVTAESPEVASGVAARVLAELDHFNQERRRSRTQAERAFAEERLDEARSQLRIAEDALQRFYSENRMYRGSPELSMRAERLEREVGLRQALYQSLTQAYEQARIDAVRQMSVLTIIDPPSQPTEPDPRGLAKRGAIAFVLGLFLAVGIALVRDTFRRRATTTAAAPVPNSSGAAAAG